MGDKEVRYIPPKKIYGEHIEVRKPSLEEVKPLFNKDINNGIHAALNDTEAAQMANSLADMEIDGKKAISKAKWDAFVADNFPNVVPNPIKKCIKVADATGSLTTYSLRQKAYEQSQKIAELQEQSGQDTAPDMGV